MIEVILDFGPMIFGGLFIFFMLGALLLAVFCRAHRYQEPLFIACMALALICLMTLFGCFMVWVEAF